MKKALAIALALVMVLALCACGNSSGTNTPAASTDNTPAASTPAASTPAAGTPSSSTPAAPGNSSDSTPAAPADPGAYAFPTVDDFAAGAAWDGKSEPTRDMDNWAASYAVINKMAEDAKQYEGVTPTQYRQLKQKSRHKAEE